MPLGFFCGSDPFGPIAPNHLDLTRCFQSLVILIPPPAFLIIAAMLRFLSLRGQTETSLLLDQLPRFPQALCLLLSLIDIVHIVYAFINGQPPLHTIITPTVDFIAWIAVIAVIRTEHRCGLPHTVAIKIYFFLSFLCGAKLAESSIIDLVRGTPLTPYDVLAFLRLFLVVFILRYAITGITSDSALSADTWKSASRPITSRLAKVQRSDSQASINSDALSNGSPSKAKSVWKRFLTVGGSGDGDSNDDGNEGGDSDYHAMESNNPFAEVDNSDSRNPFADTVISINGSGTNNNPFGSIDSRNSKRQSTVVSSLDIASNHGSASNVPSSQQLLSSHPLSGAIGTIPHYQESLIGGRSVIQYQLRTQLTLSTVIAHDADIDTIVSWKRWREFEGLHDSITVTAKKFHLIAPCLPPQPKKNDLDEARLSMEDYCNSLLKQPFFFEDFALFVNVDEKVNAIKDFKEREKEAKQAKKENEALQLKQARNGASINGISLNGTLSQSVSQPTLPRPLHHSTSQSITGNNDSSWSIIAVTVPSISRWSKASVGDKKSTHSFYLTFDIKVTSLTDSEYFTYKRPHQIIDFRSLFYKELHSRNTALSVPHCAIKGELKDKDRKDEAMLDTNANIVEIFLQSLINATAFQKDSLRNFLGKRRKLEAGNSASVEPHEMSGQKPIETFYRSTKQWKINQDVQNPVVQPQPQALPQQDSQPVARSVSAGSRSASRRATNTDASTAAANASTVTPTRRGRRAAARDSALFPDLAAPASPTDTAMSPSHSAQSMSQTSSPPSQSSPIASSHASANNEASHRFQVFIPHYEAADSADPKSPILFTIIIREFFTLTSFIEWSVVRRYRDFDKMHRVLQSMFTDYDFPSLPSKSSLSLTRGKKIEEKLESRRQQLELYIQKIINVRQFQVDEFFAFFDLNNANRVFSVGTATAGNAVATTNNAVSNNSNNINTMTSSSNVTSRGHHSRTASSNPFDS